MNDKKYYWIKLRTDFFDREDIDFLLSQENGCQYVVLYQMLCLNTANTGGRLESKMNEVIIPYDIKKIVRDTKYFDTDTVVVALELYKKLGLIYEEENEILKIAEIEKMIGCETAWAEKKRVYREKQKLLEDKVEDNVLEDIRDKRLDIRDKDIDIDISKGTHRFKKPTLEEVKEYCKERNNQVDAERFIDFYESKGWKVGNQSMKDWKACVRTWEKKETKKEEIDWEAFYKEVEERERKAKEEIKPSWLGKEIEKVKPTDEERQEMEDLFKDLR